MDDPLNNLQICLAIPDTTIREENHYLSRTTKWQAIVLNFQDTGWETLVALINF
ncbi:hypothetical protein [Nostoc sp. FACHB-110]|uniref:hypothetical protein n=1 Tax=Nostoc sp. FACHB-110 TaxID=2692834 RepID=UPI0016856CF1|nr:hypothetical protein [Nostoc sp. FACHB-110]MBD2436846.1 hypothetical protein [Nostoc sp. FACHB-110]